MILPLVSVIFATTTWYLLSMAELTRAIWSRYPPWLDAWMSCPACSGAWWTGGWALLLSQGYGWDFFGLHDWTIFPLGVLWGCFWVPLAAWLLDRALRTRGEVPAERSPFLDLPEPDEAPQGAGLRAIVASALEEGLARVVCEDCGNVQPLAWKPNHHGGEKLVCVDRDACNSRSPG